MDVMIVVIARIQIVMNVFGYCPPAHEQLQNSSFIIERDFNTTSTIECLWGWGQDATKNNVTSNLP